MAVLPRVTLLLALALFAPTAWALQLGIAGRITAPRSAAAPCRMTEIVESADADQPAVQRTPPAVAGEVQNPALIPFTEMELAEQSTKLDALTKKWAKRQQQENDKDTQAVGFVKNAEQINGRLAMFFILTGLITEYYTGESLPQQCYTLFQTLGIVD